MSNVIAADSLSGESVAVGRPGMVSVEVDSELVVYDDRAKVMHHLNRPASVLWTCLDGSGSLAEIADDIADVYQVSSDEVLHDIVVTARQLGAKGLLVGVRGDDDTDDVDDNRAPEPEHPSSELDLGFVAEMPRPCMDRSFPLGEAGLLTVEVGEHLLGVRLSTPELTEMARAVLAPSLVTGVQAPANVSLVLTDGKRGRGLYWCYRSGQLLTRTRGPHRAFEAVTAMLSTYNGEDTGRYVRFPGAVFVRDGQAAILSPLGRHLIDALAPRLRRSGWALADSGETLVDPASGEVVIAGPTVEIDPDALAGLATDPTDAPPPPPGSYPVAAWVVVGEEGDEPSTHAGRVALVAASATDTTDATVVLQAATAITAEARWLTCPGLNAVAVAAKFAAVLG